MEGRPETRRGLLGTVLSPGKAKNKQQEKDATVASASRCRESVVGYLGRGHNPCKGWEVKTSQESSGHAGRQGLVGHLRTPGAVLEPADVRK